MKQFANNNKLIVLTIIVIAQPTIAEPTGYLPICPGVTKNVTISNITLQKIQVIVHKQSESGIILKIPLSIVTAPHVLEKEKLFDFKRKTILYFVGFKDSSGYPLSLNIGDLYCKLGYNVMIADYTFLNYVYPRSVRASRIVGKKIGGMLVKLTKIGLQADKLELTGISLGAHIAAYAAKEFYAITGKRAYRVTGLDPAGPCFRTLPSSLRLDKSDAIHVDVVHTNIDGFGIAEPLGHIDFYINGGEFQLAEIPSIPCLTLCSHIKVLMYWWKALEYPKKFIAVKCDSIGDARSARCFNNSVTNVMGLEANFDKPGIYYLSVLNTPPFFRGRDGLKAENEIFYSSTAAMNAENNFVF